MHDRFGARCKAAKATEAASKLCIYHLIYSRIVIAKAMPMFRITKMIEKWSSKGLTSLSSQTSASSLWLLFFCPIYTPPPNLPPQSKGKGASSNPGYTTHSRKLILVEPCSSFASQLTAHCAVTQIAWKSIILEIEIDVFLTVRQKCFEACLILLSTFSSVPFRLSPKGALKTSLKESSFRPLV